MWGCFRGFFDFLSLAGTTHLTIKYLTQYEQLGRIDDLNEAVDFGQEALSLCPHEHRHRSSALNNLALCLFSRYGRLGEIDDLNEAIDLNREALLLRPPGHPDRPTSLISLTKSLTSQYLLRGEIDDLNEGIVFSREALLLCPSGHRIHPTALSSLAAVLSIRYDPLGEVGDLNEAIDLNREFLSLCPRGHPERVMALINLAKCLSSQYLLLGQIDTLNESTVLDREAVSLCPAEHPFRPMSLSNLAANLSIRFEWLGKIDDLNEAIVLTRESLSLRPHGHPDRPMSLVNLSKCLSSRCEQLGEIDDLNEAIVLDREALSLCSLGHPSCSICLRRYAADLSSRCHHFGKIDDLNEAIVLAQEALSLCPPGHPDRLSSLSGLAAHLSSRYMESGGIDDLNEAIVLAREALSLCPPGHPGCSSSLSDLAVHLSSRYRQLGGIDDLEEAIVHSLEALPLYPPGHPGRPMSLDNLALYLSSRYHQFVGIDDLNEAIVLARKALSLRPLGHPDRPLSLSNLSVHLSSRYDQSAKIDDMNEAIVLEREALSLWPPGHPSRSQSLANLAISLSSRYDRLMGIEDLDEAIFLAREAFSLCPPGHPSRSRSLRILATHLSSRYEQLSKIGDLNGAAENKQELLSLYTDLERVSQTALSEDLSAAKAWINAAETFDHFSALRAYETALRLLAQHSAALPSLPHHLDLLKSLSSSLGVDAFSACLRNHSPAKAVELLEQGRAVFWSQLTRLRSPLESVIESGPQGKVLADEFARLTSLVRNALQSPGSDQHDRVCRLNLELQKVVSKIRELPGLSRFLLPLLFSDLQRAASDGPVIIMNSCEYGCDALIVFADKDPIHIPLSVTQEYIRDLSLRFRKLTKSAKRMNMVRELGVFLRELWDKLVSHIVNVLRTICDVNSHIWWCPTAEFSLLPLHAAGPYRRGEKNLSSLYVSSYTTTLTALIHARRPPSVSHGVAGKPHFIAIGQATPKDASPLLHVGTELDKVSQLVDGLTSFTRIEREDACIPNVADKLGENEWVHLACHGIPSQEKPFESAFALHDGPFTIQRISQCNLQNPEFAYLSACHTTVGYKESPDEMIHLAAAMQFAGFRSVIGTMSAVDDSQTDKIISIFYEFMIDESGRLDYTRAARALRMTMRNADIPLDQRILYIHLGA